MDGDGKKKAVAAAAVRLVEPGWVIGVGTGSTVNHFIDELGRVSGTIAGAVASSEASASRLASCEIKVLQLNDVGRMPLYVDGADEATRQGFLIKGGGGALTREKIVAAACDRFVCIIDDSKVVDRLGAFPLPIEVVPMALRLVSDEIKNLGGSPVPREGFTTDNGNQILDVSGLDLSDPPSMERLLNQIPGVLTNGLFCDQRADLLLVAGDDGVERLE